MRGQKSLNFHSREPVSYTHLDVYKRQQLEGMGLIRQMKSGTEIAIKRNYTRKEYYENAKAYLINPVQKEITIMRCEATFESFSAGETALSQESELNPPRIEERAIYKGEEVVDQLEIVDARSEDQMCIRDR